MVDNACPTTIEEIETGAETGLEAAVIGMACRFPGAPDIEKFWENLTKGVESVRFFTGEELEKEGVDPSLVNDPNFIKAAVYLEDVEYFDASFFGYSPREAEVMDPQVRFFLECTHHALEDAGVNPDEYNGFIGVYTGASSHFNWQARVLLSGAENNLDPYSVANLKDKDFMSVHTSYRLNLKGPSVLLSTACSTSLSAVVLGYQALLSGDCDIAVSGGSTIRVPQRPGYIYQEGMIASPDGHCRTFDAESSGTMAGNGTGVVVLKLLSRALEDHDHIYAVIKGSGLNNDGQRKAGFTAPSIDGQAEVIRAAHRMADVPPESITYVECHGTATKLGDPIEIEALKVAFNTDKKGFCGVGSVKSNMGHLDVAAGVAGFIKAVLCLYHKQIPPSLHFKKPNPKIDFENSPFYVNATLKEWHRDKTPLRAGVSSFGIGGTNAHVVLEEAPAHAQRKEKARDYSFLPLSAKTETALEKAAENLSDYLKKNPHVNLEDVAYTLQVGRKRCPHRRTVAAASVEEAIEALSSPGSPGRHSFICKDDRHSLVFMFPGQGAQYVHMGLDLYKKEPVFREALDRCFHILLPLLGLDMKTLLYPGLNADVPGDVSSFQEKIDQTEITQPLLFAFEYALAFLLMSWDLKPNAMIGHSIGEYVAAHLSGVFSLEDALRLVVLRGKLMQQLPHGSMVSVPLSEEELQPFMDPAISLAAVNAPALCTVSGPTDAVAAFEQRIADAGFEARRLHTSHAFHSPMMDPVLQDFEAAVRQVKLNPPQVPYVSNLTGDWITAKQTQDPAYWAQHLRQTVQFNRCASVLLKEENAVFLEVGPGVTLSTFIGKNADKKPAHKVLNLVRHAKENTRDDAFLLTKVGQLWLYGARIDWDAFYAGAKEKPVKLPLPLYPFDRQRYRIDETAMRRQAPQAAVNKDMSRWFYQPSWKQARLPERKKIAFQESDVCIIFAPRKGLGAGWGELIAQKAGVPVIHVEQGQDFASLQPGHYSVKPSNPTHFEELFLRLHNDKKIPRWILHLWNLSDDTRGMETRVNSETEIENDLDRAYYSLLHIAAAVGKYYLEETIEMAVVTDGLQDVWGEAVHRVERGVLLGAVRSIPMEYPQLHCRGIDIEKINTADGSDAGIRDSGKYIELLIKELSVEIDLCDNWIAYRNFTRWVQGVEPFPLIETQEADEPSFLAGHRLKKGGVYLVTGGTGGIGLELAGYLVERAQAAVILVSRSGFLPRDRWGEALEKLPGNERVREVILKIRAMEEKGGKVLIFGADVSDEQSMGRVIREAESQLGPIQGIIHAAGIPDAGMIQRRTREMSEAVFKSKVKGTLVLEKCFKDRRLDFLVLCSSLVSILGAFGQVAYAAANCFLDTYAQKQQDANSSFRYVAGINWDTWLEVGMAVETFKKMPGSVHTLHTGITPPTGRELLNRILAENVPRVYISMRDLLQLIKDNVEEMDSHIRTLGSAAGESEEAAGAGEKVGTLHPRPELSTEFVAPGTTAEQMLASVVMQMLGIDRVGIFDNFFELGLSSLDVINITNKLKKNAGVEIAAVNVFENPTIQALGRFLDLQQAGKTGGAASTTEEIEEKIDRTEEIQTGKNRLKQMLKKTRESVDEGE